MNKFILTIACLTLSINTNAQSTITPIPGFSDPATSSPAETKLLPNNYPNNSTFGNSRGNEFPSPQQQQDPTNFAGGVKSGSDIDDNENAVPSTLPNTTPRSSINEFVPGVGTGVETNPPSP